MRLAQLMEQLTHIQSELKDGDNPEVYITHENLQEFSYLVLAVNREPTNLDIGVDVHLTVANIQYDDVYS
jgi:hypothetical protein